MKTDDFPGDDYQTPTHIGCNICGNTQPNIIFKAGIAQQNQIVRCGNCGLIYASPREHLIDSDDYERYDATGLLDGVDQRTDHPYRWRFDKERFQTRDYDSTRSTLNSVLPNRGRLVEIGCSMGQLLQLFRNDSWIVQGVDPWREAALYTSKTMGIPCSATTLEGANFPDDYFDAAVMLHVIEHVENPLQTMRELHRVLKSGGYAVVETPRYDSLMFKIFGRRERSISCNGHIYFFTNRTLQALCNKAGFEVVEHICNGRSLSLQRGLWNIAVMSRMPILKKWVESLDGASRLQKVGIYINLRDMQRVLIRKL